MMKRICTWYLDRTFKPQPFGPIGFIHFINGF